MTIRLGRWALSLAAICALTLFFAGGALAGYWYATDDPDPAATAVLPSDIAGGGANPDQWKPFREAYDLLNKEYYGRPIDQEKLVRGATEGMVKSLGDDYTSYLPPEQRQQLQEQMGGRFQGIGVYVDPRGGKFTITSPIEGSPAEKAGLRAGDIIEAVNGQSIRGVELAKVISKIKGPAGTSVRLTIRRGVAAPFDVEVARAEIRVPQVTYKKVVDDLAYIDVNIFGDKSTDELDQALRQAQADGVRGIILDLRNNGGGWVNAAQEMLGRFLPDGVALYEDPTQGPGGERPKDIIHGDVQVYDTPMVVLVNKGSASASEIVAGALQARGRAQLVGETTFGKGSEQSVHGLSGGSSLHVTIAHWLTPDKRDIHGKGLKPEHIVKTGKQDQEAKGPQFDRAVRVVRSLIR